MLFHGAKPEAIGTILRTGFEKRLAGSANGAVSGWGGGTHKRGETEEGLSSAIVKHMFFVLLYMFSFGSSLWLGRCRMVSIG